jgi:drug/metabolite transporter (DMT)-like permease
LSTVEPVVTVLLAAALLGDRLSPVQLVGGALVLAAVVVLQGLHLWKPGPPEIVNSGSVG